MAGLDPAIHVMRHGGGATWMPGSSPGMTTWEGGEGSKKGQLCRRI